MDCDSNWYAYQCHSGEVLFHFNSVTGEHKWAVHFCSCLKPKSSNSPLDPCCTWQPVKAKSSQSGKFMRSIATETEEEYFSNVNSSNLTVASDKRSIFSDKEQGNRRLNPSASEKRGDICTPFRNRTSDVQESSLTSTDNEEPVEVVLSDPFLPQSSKSVFSKRLTLKLAESPKEEFSISNYPNSKKLSSLEPLITSLKKENDYQTESNTNVVQKDKIFASFNSELPSFCVDDDSQTFESSSKKPPKRVVSSSSRKNPEPKKLKRKHNINVKDTVEHEDDEESYDKGWEESFGECTDETEEAYLQSPIVKVELGNLSSFPDEDNAEEPISTACTLCGKECNTPSELTNHLMNHQPSGTKCPVCHKFFSRRQGLRYHIQTHAGDKPHVCKLCNKTFTKSSSLVAHVRAHSGIKPFKCPKCNKGFTHSSNLSSHLRIHSSLRPYRCKFCGKGFKTSSHLSLHLRCHSDERPYKCNECGKAFKNSSHLKSHKKLHSTEKNVICGSCNEGFKNFAQLMSHQRINTECHGVVQNQKESRHSVSLPSSLSGHSGGHINDSEKSEIVELGTPSDGGHSFVVHTDFEKTYENETDLSDNGEKQSETQEENRGFLET